MFWGKEWRLRNVVGSCELLVSVESSGASRVRRRPERFPSRKNAHLTDED